MCGRYVRDEEPKHWVDVLEFSQPIQLRLDPAEGPRYNICPSQKTSIIYSDGDDQVLENVKWGWAPHWAKEKWRPPTMARVDKVADSKFWRAIWKHRALVLVSGWYEWIHHPTDIKIKQAYYIKPATAGPLFVAGVAQVTPGLEQAESDGFVMISDAAEAGLLDVHERRPVVLPPDLAAEWLDPATSPERALQIANNDSLGTEAFSWHPVGPAVGYWKNQGPELITPVPADPRL